ncbi:adenosylcobinamide-GDP ribazoletransferase [Desulfonatronovibrio hydrogenovorans]|uniref:adenosylcobinamide-GDP ribazoletransferase n=1 Tax=Desulfonatronovibrio hydrogenovorans TaxID=53245 RepID=UPI00048AED4F|nr:adenosylcobinamide-GDP ribazoletransferase [Desulfonatronovibrio hydrogenovorans]
MQAASSFMLAMSFLTRMVPARSGDEESLAGSMAWFSLVGLVLGVIMVLPCLLGLAGNYPLVQALMVLGLGFYLTRGLHWDGWADLWDGWASQADGERFWTIVKDSRTGAFGVAGIFFGLGGQLVLLGEVIRLEQWAVIVWAVVLGRFGAWALAFVGKDLSRPGLGSLFIKGGTRTRAIVLNLAVTLGLALVLVPIKTVLISGLLLAGGLVFFYRLGRKMKGINGDFLGAAIIWGEISGLLGHLIL